MDFETWEPYYKRILVDFGFSPFPYYFLGLGLGALIVYYWPTISEWLP